MKERWVGTGQKEEVQSQQQVLTSGMSSCTCACQRKNKHEENEASERQDEKTSGSCKNQLNITL